MKITILALLATFTLSGHAQAKDVKICRDGHYLVASSAAGNASVLQILAAGTAANRLTMQSNGRLPTSAVYSVVLLSEEGYNDLTLAADIQGTLIECDSPLSM